MSSQAKDTREKRARIVDKHIEEQVENNVHHRQWVVKNQPGNWAQTSQAGVVEQRINQMKRNSLAQDAGEDSRDFQTPHEMTGQEHYQYDQLVSGYNIPQTHLSDLAQVKRVSLAQDDSRNYNLPHEMTGA